MDVDSCIGNQKTIIEVSTIVISDDKLLCFIVSENKIKIIYVEVMQIFYNIRVKSPSCPTLNSANLSPCQKLIEGHFP
jgi:hypothetical protein